MLRGTKNIDNMKTMHFLVLYATEYIYDILYNNYGYCMMYEKKCLSKVSTKTILIKDA